MRLYPPRNITAFPKAITRGGTTTIIMPTYPPPKEDRAPRNPHEQGFSSFARIFANERAASVIKDAIPIFPVGSIIVREKLLKADDAQPELVTVMVKREKGFSPKSGDWEYFILSGDLTKIKEQEKVGSCSKCHAQAKETDYVFREFLK